MGGCTLFSEECYQMTGYNENGDAKELELTASKNLRKYAYLVIKYRDKVLTYEVVEKSEVPVKALEALEK